MIAMANIASQTERRSDWKRTSGYRRADMARTLATEDIDTQLHLREVIGPVQLGSRIFGIERAVTRAATATDIIQTRPERRADRLEWAWIVWH
jgi:hypothetical protein